MLKFKLILLLALFCVVSCKQQEVNPVKPTTDTEENNERIINTFIYKGQTYSRAVWKKKFADVEQKTHVIVENDQAYLFDTEKEAEDYSLELNKKSRFKGISFALGRLQSFNVDASVSIQTISRYYQCELIFYEHEHYRGRSIRYRVQGVISKNWRGATRNNLYRNRPAPEWARRISSYKINHIIYPSTKRSISLGPKKFYQENGPASMTLTVYKNRNWDRGRRSNYAVRDIGRTRNGNKFHYSVMDFGWWQGNKKKWNDNVQSFELRFYDHA